MNFFFSPNYQKVSHEGTIKSNLHSRIFFSKRGDRTFVVEKIRRFAVRCVKRTDNFSAKQQKNSDKREIKCQNHLSTLHPLLVKEKKVCWEEKSVKIPPFLKGKKRLYSFFDIKIKPAAPGENCQCANSALKRRHLLTKTRRQRKSSSSSEENRKKSRFANLFSTRKISSLK